MHVPELLSGTFICRLTRQGDHRTLCPTASQDQIVLPRQTTGGNNLLCSCLSIYMLLLGISVHDCRYLSLSWP